MVTKVSGAVRVGYADRSYYFAPRWAAPAVDVAVMLCAAGAGVVRELGSRFNSYLVVLPLSAHIAVQVVASLLLLERRRRPLTMGVVVAALSLLTPTYAAFAAPYAIVAYGGRRNRIMAALVIVLACWFIGARGWTLADPFGGPLLMVLSAVMGLYARTRTALAAEVLQRAERAEHEQQLLAEQAVFAERSRMAREMHDVVAHRINMMVLQAGALRVSSKTPAVRTAAEELRSTGTEALGELRELIWVLRSPTSPPVGHPGDDSSADIEADSAAGAPSLDAMIADARRSGVDVRLSTPHDPLGPIGPLVQRTVYRVVQECITNAAKHAPGSAVSVSIDAGHSSPSNSGAESVVQVTVDNTRPERRPDPDVESTGTGTGLQELRRRVALLLGRLESGPDQDGGYHVRLVLPITPHGGTAQTPNRGGQ